MFLVARPKVKGFMDVALVHKPVATSFVKSNQNRMELFTPHTHETVPIVPHITKHLRPMLPTSTTQRPRPSVHPAPEAVFVRKELPRSCPTHTTPSSFAYCPSLVRMDALPALGEMMEQKVGGGDNTRSILKHSNTTIATYVLRQLKHLKAPLKHT